MSVGASVPHQSGAVKAGPAATETTTGPAATPEQLKEAKELAGKAKDEYAKGTDEGIEKGDGIAARVNRLLADTGDVSIAVLMSELMSIRRESQRNVLKQMLTILGNLTKEQAELSRRSDEYAKIGSDQTETKKKVALPPTFDAKKEAGFAREQGKMKDGVWEPGDVPDWLQKAEREQAEGKSYSKVRKGDIDTFSKTLANLASSKGSEIQELQLNMQRAKDNLDVATEWATGFQKSEHDTQSVIVSKF